jgi:hypothetical protein
LRRILGVAFSAKPRGSKRPTGARIPGRSSTSKVCSHCKDIESAEEFFQIGNESYGALTGTPTGAAFAFPPDWPNLKDVKASTEADEASKIRAGAAKIFIFL